MPLILIKHARPEQNPDVPSDEWPLSDAGRAACGPLADSLREFAPARLISSTEPKAAETAKLVSERLAIPCTQLKGLEEHDRSNVPLMRTGEFISAISQFFKEPNHLVLGKETANQALARFSAAVDQAISTHKTGQLAIVTHGTVIALYLADRTKVDAFTIWRKMGLPSFVVLNADQSKIEIQKSKIP